MNDRRLTPHYQTMQSPPGYSYESCSTPLFDLAWGHQAQQAPQAQPSGTSRQDETLGDFFADPDFKALIANTICTPPRPSRGSTFDPLASPVSPGNWMFTLPSVSSNTPFSPAQAAYEMQNRGQQLPLPQGRASHSALTESLHSLPPDMGHSSTSGLATACQVPDQREPYRHSSNVSYSLPPHVSDSPMLTQTPMQPPRQLSDSFSDMGQFMASSASRPTATAPVNALHGNRVSVDPRGTAMRRASSRIPKRTLEPDFDTSQSVPYPKGTTRRGPAGPSKARKASFTGTAGKLARSAEGEVSQGARGGIAGQGGSSSSICGLMSPFQLLKPFGDNGQGSLAELNKRIQESAEKPQPTSSSDTSDAGSTGQAGSITMNRLAKGVPVGASPTHY